MKRPIRLVAGAVLSFGILAGAVPIWADDLYINIGSSISLFDIVNVNGGGTSSLGSFGPSGAITGFSDREGNVWVVTYSSGVSTVQKYDGAGNPIAGTEFQVAATLQNGVVGPDGNLFLSGASGEVYEYSSSTLTQITDWNVAPGNPNLAGQGTQYTAIGIANAGGNLYTTEGDEGSFIDEWNANGTLESSVDIGISGLYGPGLDRGDFFAGYTGEVLEFDTSGDYLNGFGISGSNYSLSAGVAPAIANSVPEPGTIPLVAVAGLLAVMLYRARRASIAGWVSFPAHVWGIRIAEWAMAFLALPAAYGQIGLAINPSAISANIGSTITVSASASDPSNSGGTFTYQFNVSPPRGSNYWLIRDYSPANSFPFTTTGSEGVYTIQVIALESNGSTTSGTTQLTFMPVATAVPVVSATAHPLVAMYSLPPCPVGSQARVHFRLTGAIFWNYTSYQNCTGSTSLNFLIGGMRSSLTYTLQHDILSGPIDTLGPLMSFRTGAIPSSALNAIPEYSVTVPARAPNATAYPVLLTAPIGVAGPLAPFATDTGGNVLWYLPDFINSLQIGAYLAHPVPGGTFLVIVDQTIKQDRQLLREYDLAGNILRETNATAIGNELAAMRKDRITSISHEIFRFPNGDTGFIGSVEKVLASAYDSNSNTVHANVDVLGDMAIVLDSNFHVKWSWDEFDYSTDFSTKAVNGAPLPAYTDVLNLICTSGVGCAILQNINPSNNQVYTYANDWTHSNSLAPTPDGNLIISLRHQDMVIKINYNHGSGNGSILWRLGPQGDFGSSVAAGQTAYQFFNSHQHDAEYQSNGLLSLFDNGNSRITLYGGNSRGQAWQIDDTNLTAARLVNVDLGAYSFATGSAQRLANNNYHFYLGYIMPTATSQSVEVTTSGTDEFQVSEPTTVGYRSFRMNSLYSIAGEFVAAPFYAEPRD
jgi:hypothetical protein